MKIRNPPNEKPHTCPSTSGNSSLIENIVADGASTSRAQNLGFGPNINDIQNYWLFLYHPVPCNARV